MTNQKLDLSRLKEIYSKKNQVMIEGFADLAFAEAIFQSINAIPKENWEHNFYPEAQSSELVKTIPALDDYKAFIQLTHQMVRLEYQKGNFSYSFQKPAKTDLNATKIYARFEEFIKSSYFQSCITTVTGLKKPKLESWFISKYKKGDFLSRHNDKTNGKIGFVFYLSKNWKASFGGDLKFFLKETDEEVYTYYPGFNKLLLFSIDNDPPLFHEVMPVTEDADRIAISGWMSDEAE